MSKPFATTQLPAIVTRDTWDGLRVSFSTTGTELDDPLASVRMFFVLAGTETPALQLTTANNAITITDAAKYEFDVLPISDVTLTPGNYSWSIECTDTAGIIKTRVAGTIQVLKDATI
jgi:hypothetical protein